MKKISIFLLTVISIMTFSCDNEFDKVNTDPNNPLAVPAHLLLASTIRQTQNATYNIQQGGDMGLCWAQHWSKVQYNSEEQYIPRRGAIDNVWDVLYSGVVYDSKVMNALAIKEENSNLEGISLVVQANAFQILTDLYGPVPFTEAGVKGNLKPKYDSQQEVYVGIINLLTKADQLFALNVGEVPSTSDLIYSGNITKWRKLANSLKLKALMRISKATGINNAANIQALVSAGNLMSSNDDSALIKNIDAAATDANPIYQGLDGRLEYKVSSVLVDKMKTLNDNRLAIFAKPVGANYIGNVPGVESLNYSGTSAIGAFYNNKTLPGIILSYAQVELLLAEAANEGYISGGNAEAISHFKKGIESSFIFNGLSSTAAATYSSQTSLQFATTAAGRPIIGTQVWFALYGQGFEAWTEWRRTGFPALSPVANAALPSIPSRLYYAVNEASVNQSNYTSAVSSLSGGDKLTSRLWFMN
jgi:Starch-binding associating with outer membrane